MSGLVHDLDCLPSYLANTLDLFGILCGPGGIENRGEDLAYYARAVDATIERGREGYCLPLLLAPVERYIANNALLFEYSLPKADARLEAIAFLRFEHFQSVEAAVGNDGQAGFSGFFPLHVSDDKHGA